MRNKVRSRLIFFSRSLLWSALLYAALMLVFNWDEVSGKFRKDSTPSFTSALDSVNTHKIHSNYSPVYTILSYIYCNIGRKN